MYINIKNIKKIITQLNVGFVFVLFIGCKKQSNNQSFESPIIQTFPNTSVNVNPIGTIIIGESPLLFNDLNLIKNSLLIDKSINLNDYSYIFVSALPNNTPDREFKTSFKLVDLGQSYELQLNYFCIKGIGKKKAYSIQRLLEVEKLQRRPIQIKYINNC
jgi:hypothetical protein